MTSLLKKEGGGATIRKTKKFYLINYDTPSPTITFFPPLPPKILGNIKMEEKSRKKYSQYHHSEKMTV